MLSTAGLTTHVAHDFAIALTETESPGALVTYEEWDNLLCSSASDVVFMTWQWQTTWWRNFGAQRECKLHLLVVRDERGALVGIAPLFVGLASLPPTGEYAPGEQRPEQGPQRRVARMVGGIEIADYLDVIAPAENLPAVWSVALDYLRDIRGEWDAVDFHSLPGLSPSHEILAELGPQKGFDFQVFHEDVCPVITLPDSWESYLMSLRKKDRHELRRKVRKLESRDDVRWYLAAPADHQAIERAVHIFLDLHRKSDAEKARFMDEHMAAYFLDMAHALLNTGWLDIAILEITGQPAAAYFSFNYHKRLYLYNSGYDPKFGAYSAGVALLAYRIHKAINQGLCYFDFLRGDEPYKYDFGGKNTYVYRALANKK